MAIRNIFIISNFLMDMWTNLGFFPINFKRVQQYGHVTTLKYVLYKVAFSVCSDSFCMRWFVWGGPEIRDQWNFKLFIGSSFFSNFRTIAPHTTISPFNGEIRQRTSNTWRLQQLCLSSQDLLNDLFQQELHYNIIGQRTLSSKIWFCGNSHPRHNLRMHNRR